MNEQYDEYNEVIKQLEAKCGELERQVAVVNKDYATWRKYTGEVNDKNIQLNQQLAAQQQQIAVYRDFVIGVRDDVLYQLANYPDIPISLKELGITCEAFGQQTYNLLAQPFDTSALDRYRDEVLEEAVERLDNLIIDTYLGATGIQMSNIVAQCCDELRRMKKGQP